MSRIDSFFARVKLPSISGVAQQLSNTLYNKDLGALEGSALGHSLLPLAEPLFSKLAGVVHLAGTLADSTDAKADSVDVLPADLVAKLGLDSHWMRAKFPAADSFVNVS